MSVNDGTEHYDVIIIGTGAGGGTLAHQLAPSGKRILILERGDWLPREMQNWDATAVFVKNRYVSPDTWYDKNGKPSSRRSTTASAAPPSCTARRCTACASRISGSCGTPTAFRRPGRSATMSWSPTTPRPRSCTRCTAAAARTRRSRPAARPTRSRRSRTNRASSSCPTT